MASAVAVSVLAVLEKSLELLIVLVLERRVEGEVNVVVLATVAARRVEYVEVNAATAIPRADARNTAAIVMGEIFMWFFWALVSCFAYFCFFPSR